MITLRLPFPPSANHYNAIAVRGGRPMIYRTAKAKAFYEHVHETVWTMCDPRLPLRGRLAVDIQVSPPTKRRCDVSNWCKCIEDALQEAGMFFDDAQIDKLTVNRLPKDEAKEGYAIVTVSEV